MGRRILFGDNQGAGMNIEASRLYAKYETPLHPNELASKAYVDAAVSA